LDGSNSGIPGAIMVLCKMWSMLNCAYTMNYATDCSKHEKRYERKDLILITHSGFEGAFSGATDIIYISSFGSFAGSSRMSPCNV